MNATGTYLPSFPPPRHYRPHHKTVTMTKLDIQRPNLWNRALVGIGIQPDYVRGPAAYDSDGPCIWVCSSQAGVETTARDGRGLARVQS